MSATGISFFCLVYFISCCAHISYPFHCLPSAISYPACHIFHNLPGVIYLSISFFALGHFIPTCWIFHCLPGAIFLSISFLSLGHFIATSLHFSLPGRCDLFIHFIPCPGPFHTYLPSKGLAIALQGQILTL